MDIGSVILVVICLVLIMFLQTPPKEALLYTEFHSYSLGAWWFGFSQYTFKHLPQFGEVKTNYQRFSIAESKNIFKIINQNGGFVEVLKDNIIFYIEIVKESFRELYKVGAQLFRTANLKYF